MQILKLSTQSGIERMVTGYSNRTIQGHYNNSQTLKNLQTLSDLLLELTGTMYDLFKRWIPSGNVPL